jgi:DNA-binding transcriptional MerR regulator
MSQPDRDREVHYSMRVVTRMTGLSPDTIRAWERRYDAVVPERSEGNTRRYSALDVRRLALLKEATTRGHRIGDIATLSEEELRALPSAEVGLAASAEPDGVGPASVDRALTIVRADYLAAVERFDARVSGDLLARAAAIFRPRDFVLGLVLPILRETGDRWHRQEFSVAQEHLVSMQARSLLDAILRLASPTKGAPRIIAATPEGQLHEFGALAGAMLAALRGFDVLYLGPQVPGRDLAIAVEAGRGSVVLLSVILDISAASNARLAETIDALAEQATTWVGLPPDHGLNRLLARAVLLHEFDDFDLALTKLLN